MSRHEPFQFASEIRDHPFARINAVFQPLFCCVEIDCVGKSIFNQQLLQKSSKLSEIGQQNHHPVHDLGIFKIAERKGCKRRIDILKAGVIELPFARAVINKSLSRRNKPAKILGMLSASTGNLCDHRHTGVHSPRFRNDIATPLELVLEENKAGTGQYGKDRAEKLKPSGTIGRFQARNEETQLVPRCGHLNLLRFEVSV